jgi:predicted nuclease with TOPRIM domain
VTLTTSRAEQPRIQQELERLNSAAAQATDPQNQRDFNDRLNMQKLNAEQAEKSQQMQAHESELTNQLQSEQAKLTELNDRLDHIERALTAP